MKTFFKFCLITLAFFHCRTAPAIELPLMFDTTTLRIIIPTNILGMQFGNQFLTNLAGFGLTNVNGILRVDTNVIGTAFTPSIKWEGIPISDPNFKDTVYVSWTPSGSDFRAYVVENGLDPTRWEEINQGEFFVRYDAGSGNVQYGYVGANLNLDAVTGELSAVIPPGTNSWQIGVNGTLVVTPTLDDSPEIQRNVTSTNITDTLIDGSIATNRVNSTFLSLLLNQHRVNQWTLLPIVFTNNPAATGGLMFTTNSDGYIIGVATNLPAGGGGGAGTNAFVNGVLQQPIRHTNSTDISWGDIGGGNWGLSINDSAFYSRLTNSLIASNNVSIAYDGSTHKVMISASASGGTGTAVTVDGGSDLVRVNLADASTTFLFDLTTTNATGRLPDRDFGDITVGSSGAGMTINANSVALGTDTTGNYVATVAGTANKVDVSGSGSETAAVTVTLSDTIDIGGHTSFEIPNSSAPTTDAFGEIAGDANAWASGRGAVQFFDGTSNTYLVGVQASDTPSNGQVQKWNTGGTITWEDDNAGGISDGDKGDVTVSSSGTVWTIDNDVVTYAKIQNISAASRVLGRGDSGSGDAQELTIGEGLTIVGTSLFLTNTFGARYANGFLPLEAGISNALTGDLHIWRDSSDVRLVMNEVASFGDVNYRPGGLRSTGGKFQLVNYTTNGLSVDEVFMEYDPVSTTDDVLTFKDSGFNNKVVFDADVEFNGTVTGSGVGDVISTANNNFTQTNNFAGPINASTITVNDNAYGAGWDGSTNVPTKNAIYDKIQSLASYSIIAGGSSSAHSPSDGSTYYVGVPFQNQSSTYTTVQLVVPRTGTIVSWGMRVRVAGTLGSSETVSHYIRYNNTTDVGQIDFTYASENPSGQTTLSQAVTAGDTITVKIVGPTWTTNPTSVFYYAVIVIQ